MIPCARLEERLRPKQQDDHVFINCPFDYPYRPLFEAIVFAVQDCGYWARCALEIDDSSQARIEKIGKIIAECRFGIHDISRTELDPVTGLPRFNMPFELGLFMGAKAFGSPTQRTKIALILDSEPYRFQKFISDIAGQDPRAHHNDQRKAVEIVRDWFRNASTGSRAVIPGGRKIADRFEQFHAALPDLCRAPKLGPSKLIFNDFTTLAAEWLKINPQ
jgi:hypothetical protein